MLLIRHHKTLNIESIFWKSFLDLLNYEGPNSRKCVSEGILSFFPVLCTICSDADIVDICQVQSSIATASALPIGCVHPCYKLSNATLITTVPGPLPYVHLSLNENSTCILKIEQNIRISLEIHICFKSKICMSSLLIIIGQLIFFIT